MSSTADSSAGTGFRGGRPHAPCAEQYTVAIAAVPDKSRSITHDQ
jgi:hypothetical protein